MKSIHHVIASALMSSLLLFGCAGTDPGLEESEAVAEAEEAVSGSVCWFIYYSDSSMTTVVGHGKISCNGGQSHSGTVTIYYTATCDSCF